jgi:hypothetical protein
VNTRATAVGYIDNGLDGYSGFFDAGGVLSDDYAPVAINNLGQIVGTHDYSTWGGLSSQREGFLRNANGTIVSLGDDFYPVAINSLGQIAGFTPGDDGGIFDPGAIYSSGIKEATDGHFTPIKYVKYAGAAFAPQPVGMNDLGPGRRLLRGLPGPRSRLHVRRRRQLVRD